MSEPLCPCPPDYRAAASRHYQDALLLQEHKRLANADHHFGIAAECALLTCGENFRGGAELLEGRELRHHINSLWPKFKRTAQARRGGIYVSKLEQVYGKDNPFADWDVCQRYCADEALAQVPLDKHRQAAEVCLGLLRIGQK